MSALELQSKSTTSTDPPPTCLPGTTDTSNSTRGDHPIDDKSDSHPVSNEERVKVPRASANHESYVSSWHTQILALFRKNGQHFKNSPFTLLSIFSLTTIFLFVLMLSVSIYDSTVGGPTLDESDTDVSSFGSISKCEAENVFGEIDSLSGIPCQTITFVPSTDAFVVDVMHRYSRMTSLQYGTDIVGYETSEALTVGLGGSFGTAKQFVVLFENLNNVTVGGINGDIHFTVFYNDSMSNDYDDLSLVSIHEGIRQAALYSLTDAPTSLQVPSSGGFFTLPSYEDIVRGEGESFEREETEEEEEAKIRKREHHILTEHVGFFLFLLGVLATSMVVKGVVTEESTTKTLAMMRMMGLQESAYWLTWYTTVAVLGFFASLIFVSIGNASGLTFFTRVDYWIHVLTFWMFFLSMCMFSIFLSSITSARFSQGLSFIVFIVVIITAVFLSDINPLYKETTSGGLFLIYFLFPWFNFQKVFFHALEASKAEHGYVQFNQTTTIYASVAYEYKMSAFDQPASFNDCNILEDIDCCEVEEWQTSPCFEAKSDAFAVWFMFGSSVMYLVFCWYFSQVRDDGLGASKPFTFPFSPEYWGFGTTSTRENLVAGDRWEEERVLSHEEGSIRARKLTKSYKGVTAVKELSLAIKPGEVFVLLGHNGAGKTTTLNMLSGLTTPTFGDCFAMGHDIKTEASTVQRMIGTCPQENILWEGLTAYDHLMLYGSLRGIPVLKLRSMIGDKLGEFYLRDMMHKTASSMSGGMKRRLCMAIATLGSPRIVFLDEPTTGMDPVNKHRVWDAIRAMKKNTIVVLTTHSMEEADFLGDRIGMMKGGRLRALGSSLFLKTTYGSGYQIRMLTHESSSSALEKVVADKLPHSSIVSSSAGNVTVSIPRSSVRHLPKFFAWVQSARLRDVLMVESENENESAHGEKDKEEEQGGKEGVDESQVAISQWTFSNTTLEEVFLKVCADDFEINQGGVNQNAPVELRRSCVLCKEKQSENVTLYTEDRVGVTVENVVCGRCARYGLYAQDKAEGKEKKEEEAAEGEKKEKDANQWWDEKEMDQSLALLRSIGAANEEEEKKKNEKEESERESLMSGTDSLKGEKGTTSLPPSSSQVKLSFGSEDDRSYKYLKQLRGIFLKNIQFQVLARKSLILKVVVMMALILLTFFIKASTTSCPDNILVEEYEQNDDGSHCSVESRVEEYRELFENDNYGRESDSYDLSVHSYHDDIVHIHVTVPSLDLIPLINQLDFGENVYLNITLETALENITRAHETFSELEPFSDSRYYYSVKSLPGDSMYYFILISILFSLPPTSLFLFVSRTFLFLVVAWFFLALSSQHSCLDLHHSLSLSLFPTLSLAPTLSCSHSHTFLSFFFSPYAHHFLPKKKPKPKKKGIYESYREFSDSARTYFKSLYPNLYVRVNEIDFTTLTFNYDFYNRRYSYGLNTGALVNESTYNGYYLRASTYYGEFLPY